MLHNIILFRIICQDPESRSKIAERHGASPRRGQATSALGEQGGPQQGLSGRDRQAPAAQTMTLLACLVEVAATIEFQQASSEPWGHHRQS